MIPSRTIAAAPRLTALAELVDDEVAQRPQLDFPGLVAELRTRADARHPPVVQGVALASLHAAKGLEWDVVHLVGLTEGTLPIQHARTDQQVDEERRLLYVGITRARTMLALSWALSRPAMTMRLPSWRFSGAANSAPTPSSVVSTAPATMRFQCQSTSSSRPA